MARHFVLEGRDLGSYCGQMDACEANRENWVVGEHNPIHFRLFIYHLCHAVDELFEALLAPGEVSEDQNVEDKLSFSPCA